TAPSTFCLMVPRMSAMISSLQLMPGDLVAHGAHRQPRLFGRRKIVKLVLGHALSHLCRRRSGFCLHLSFLHLLGNGHRCPLGFADCWHSTLLKCGGPGLESNRQPVAYEATALSHLSYRALLSFQVW